MFSISTVASSTRMPTARCQSTQRHDIDGFVEGAKAKHADENGQRDGNGDDQSALPVAEE